LDPAHRRWVSFWLQAASLQENPGRDSTTHHPKKSSAAMISPRCWCLDRFATAHCRAADAERREA